MGNSINSNNWGKLALAKFERVATAESSDSRHIGASKGLAQARNNSPQDISKILHKTRAFSRPPIEDSAQLSPEALKLMGAIDQ